MNDTLAIPRGVTAAFAKAGLAEGTNAATIKIEAPNGAGVDFAIDGVGYHKADTDNVALTAAAAQADLTTCLYLIQIDSAGTVSSKKGVEELNADLDSGKRVLHWPEPDDDQCPLGAVKVKLTGTTFTAGTTDLGAANVEDTYYDFVGGAPQAPLTS
jgi:hypothetical protein